MWCVDRSGRRYGRDWDGCDDNWCSGTRTGHIDVVMLACDATLDLAGCIETAQSVVPGVDDAYVVDCVAQQRGCGF